MTISESIAVGPSTATPTRSASLAAESDATSLNDPPEANWASFSAAGTGVMFLLFSMGGAAGFVLLEEAESGTLERLLCTRIGMSGILFGKWAFLVAVGFAQLSVMFLWGSVAFGLPLFSHLGGFVVMTLAKTAAAAALALVLATLARKWEAV